MTAIEAIMALGATRELAERICNDWRVPVVAPSHMEVWDRKLFALLDWESPEEGYVQGYACTYVTRQDNLLLVDTSGNRCLGQEEEAVYSLL